MRSANACMRMHSRRKARGEVPLAVYEGGEETDDGDFFSFRPPRPAGRSVTVGKKIKVADVWTTFSHLCGNFLQILIKLL